MKQIEQAVERLKRIIKNGYLYDHCEACYGEGYYEYMNEQESKCDYCDGTGFDILMVEERNAINKAIEILTLYLSTNEITEGEIEKVVSNPPLDKYNRYLWTPPEPGYAKNLSRALNSLFTAKMMGLREENEELKQGIEKALNKDEGNKILLARIEDLKQQIRRLKDERE